MDDDQPRASSIHLTLDGAVPAIPPRSLGAMRWVPPEQAAAIRADAGQKATTKTRRTA